MAPADGLGEPFILAEEAAYLVVYKPPGMHSVPLKTRKDLGKGPGERTLLDWCADTYPELLNVRGWNPWEGGIVHRLDYGTSGLVLFARNQAGMDALRAQQDRGLFWKEYRALSAGPSGTPLPGFPPRPAGLSLSSPKPLEIISQFRPYGPGGKAVRPEVSDKKSYQTTILEIEHRGGVYSFRIGIHRGFRHQIRCHLAWLGYPISNDSLYGGAAGGASQVFLALEAWKVSFQDPWSGQAREYSIENEE